VAAVEVLFDDSVGDAFMVLSFFDFFDGLVDDGAWSLDDLAFSDGFGLSSVLSFSASNFSRLRSLAASFLAFRLSF
jgi:hypothetical protein